MNIIEEMKVKPTIDAVEEIRTRVEFIKKQLLDSGSKALVLGISGGVDSFTCGSLAQLAVKELREEQDDCLYCFYAVRLPYGKQLDEEDAQRSLKYIDPDYTLIVNVGAATDAISSEVARELPYIDCLALDFSKGNSKARMRMLAQYQIAGMVGGLVLGTDHSAENVTGFYTKFGDGACDLAPLFGLNKRQVRELAQTFGAPVEIYNKTPTADLESLSPQKKDEDVLGITYNDLDDYLEGKTVSPAVEAKIIRQYNKTQHKRSEIPTP